MSRKQRVCLGAAAVGLLGLVTACGGGGTGSSGNTGAAGGGASSGNSNVSASQGKPQDGGSIVIGQSQPFNDTLLPFETSSGYTNFVVQFAYDTLLTTDQQLNFKPMLASKWQWSPDHLTLTMWLRDAKWSDGTPITSDDVLFAMNTLANPDYTKVLQGPDAYYVSSVKGFQQIQAGHATSFADTGGFTKVNDHEFQIHFTTVDAAVLYSDIANISPLPSKYLSSTPIKDWINSDISKHPTVVSGAYEYQQVNHTDSVVLTPNPYYWNGKAHISKITIETINNDIAPGMLANGTLDMYSGFQPQDIPKLSQLPNVNVKKYPTLNYAFVGLKLYQPEFQDVRVRQAFEYAFNRQEMARAITAGMGTVVNSPIVPFSWAGATAQDGLNTYPYDPAKANQLLDEAGWTKQPDGWRIDPTTHQTADIHLLYSTNSPTSQTEAVSIQQFLKAVGVKVTLDTPVDWNTFVSKILSKDKSVQMFFVSFGPSVDPDPREMWSEGAVFNVDDWSDKTNDALIAKTYDQAAFNKADRKQALIAWQRYVNQQLPELFLWENQGLIAYSKRLHIPDQDWEVYGPINFNNWWVSQ
ncbi:MAG: hypothetical protein K6T78_15090 [Alicyclobacillus sp.]|nr:hypothetical protein [Alicyclobacillus sp.]